MNAFRAAFDIEYDGAYADIVASCPAPDDTLTIRPYPARAILGANTRQTSITPKTFVAKVSRYASGGIESTSSFSNNSTAALLTSTSTEPTRSVTIRWAETMLSTSVTSILTLIARGPDRVRVTARALEGRSVPPCKHHREPPRQQLTTRLEPEAAIGTRHERDAWFGAAHTRILAAWSCTICEFGSQRNRSFSIYTGTTAIATLGSSGRMATGLGSPRSRVSELTDGLIARRNTHRDASPPA